MHPTFSYTCTFSFLPTNYVTFTDYFMTFLITNTFSTFLRSSTSKSTKVEDPALHWNTWWVKIYKEIVIQNTQKPSKATVITRFSLALLNTSQPHCASASIIPWGGVALSSQLLCYSNKWVKWKTLLLPVLLLKGSIPFFLWHFGEFGCRGKE